MTVDLNRYSQFVNAVTSVPSRDLTKFMNRLDELDANFNYETDTHGPDINVPLLITGAITNISPGTIFYYYDRSNNNDDYN